MDALIPAISKLINILNTTGNNTRQLAFDEPNFTTTIIGTVAFKYMLNDVTVKHTIQEFVLNSNPTSTLSNYVLNSDLTTTLATYRLITNNAFTAKTNTGSYTSLGTFISNKTSGDYFNFS
jgi:hypothetical protein